MKTLKQVLKQYPEYKGIIKYTYENIAKDNEEDDYNPFQDILNSSCGINGGYPGFTWYTDTAAMANKYQKEILNLLDNYSNDFGESILTICTNFVALRKLDKEDERDLFKYLGGIKVKNNDTITDTMCKFAGEEVCRWFCEDDE